MFPKAVNSGTDIVCIELEDGIAPKDKDEARKLTLSLFNTVLDGKGAELIVRINSVRDEFGLADIRAILETSSYTCNHTPKVKTPDEVKWVDELLSEREHKTRLHVIIETNAGLEAVYDIAKSSNRIDALFFGGVDMAAELRQKMPGNPFIC